MRRAKSHVLCSDRSSWTSHEWEERWKGAHKSHLVHYLLSTAAEESELVLGLNVQIKATQPCLSSPPPQERCWDWLCRAAPWEKPSGVFSWGFSLVFSEKPQQRVGLTLDITWACLPHAWLIWFRINVWVTSLGTWRGEAAGWELLRL